MIQPKTIQQYKEFLDDFGVSRSVVREKFGDLRRLDTWKAAYGHYTYPELPLIKYLNQLSQEENNLTSSELPTLPPQETPEVPQVLEVAQISSTLEQEHRSFPTLPLRLYIPSFPRGEKSKFNQLEVVEVNWESKTPQPTLLPSPHLEILTLIRWVGLPMVINFQLCEKCVGARSPFFNTS